MKKLTLELPLLRRVRGRHYISLLVSRIFEKKYIRPILGLNLVAAVLFTGIISPEAGSLIDQFQIGKSIPTTPIAVDIATKTTIDMPLVDFRLSQYFSWYHPGIDMVAPAGTPVYAIDEGSVEYAGDVFFGYSKHVIISHPHGFKSLYAHLSKIETVNGRQIQRGELIGRVGSTGWSTGDHLHLEIYINGAPVNPLEILPVKNSEIKLDGLIFSSPASPAAEIQTGI